MFVSTLEVGRMNVVDLNRSIAGGSVQTKQTWYTNIEKEYKSPLTMIIHSFNDKSI